MHSALAGMLDGSSKPGERLGDTVHFGAASGAFPCVTLPVRIAGDELELRILRGREELQIAPTVRERQDRASLLEHLVHAEKNLISRLGILCIQIDKEVSAKIPGLRRECGLIVAAQTSGGESQSINLEPGDSVVLQIERDERFQYLAFELDRLSNQAPAGRLLSQFGVRLDITQHVGP